MRPKIGGDSPWGTIDYIRQLAPGIIIVGTPGHGGIVVENERLTYIPKHRIKFAEHWTGHHKEGVWFEEDCAVAAVIDRWPSLFPHINLNSIESQLKTVDTYEYP